MSARRLNCFSPVLAMVLLLVSGWISESVTVAQDLSRQESTGVRNFKQMINRAGGFYQAQNFKSSAAEIRKAMKLLETLVEEPSAELLEALKSDYQRLQKAHELLVAQKQRLAEVPALPQPMTAGDDTATAISFKDQVAPILVAKCGNCHVNQNRGDFSAASYTALVDSTTIAFGKPDDSRLIEVIENGEMPKGGLKVEPQELETLKKWIAAGAKFDGTDRGQNLAALARVTPPQPRRQRMEANLPTGKETVSFGLDVAPVLLEKCGQCHINQNPRGNFSMANFRNLLRGGDGGNPVQPGDSSASLLIKRLRGDGVAVMPPRDKLDDKIIEQIAKWVEEGAAFDGRDVQLDLASVAATVKAASMSHADLVEDRESAAGKTWKLVMTDVDSNTVDSPNFLVTGSTSEERVSEVSELSESLAKKIADTLKVPQGQPLVKGNISVFLFERRYDFSEFGRMVEQRDFPRELKAYWNFTTVDAYASVLMTRNQSPEDLSVSLAQQIAALHTASLSPDVPRWFADGVGLWTAKKILPREEQLKDLDQQAKQAANSMQRVDDFVQNRMAADQAGKVAYLFVQQLRAGSAANFGKLMKRLQAGDSFESSFQELYGQSPAALLNQFAKRNRR